MAHMGEAAQRLAVWCLALAATGATQLPGSTSQADDSAEYHIQYEDLEIGDVIGEGRVVMGGCEVDGPRVRMTPTTDGPVLRLGVSLDEFCRSVVTTLAETT